MMAIRKRHVSLGAIGRPPRSSCGTFPGMSRWSRAVARALGRAAYWSIPGAVAAALFVRLRYGIDFSDESFYSALPYSFWLGHRPFVDESLIHQLGGLVAYPVAWIRLELTGGVEGLYLYFRHCYFVVAIACAVLVTRRLGHVVPRVLSASLGAVVLAWVPFSIPSLSYNTLACFGTLAGLLLIVPLDPRPRTALGPFCGALALAAAALAYPPMLVPAALALAIAIALREGGQGPDSRAAAARAIGFALAIATLIAGLVAVGTSAQDGVDRVLALTRAMGIQGGGASKLSGLLREVGVELSMLLAFSALFFAEAVACRTLIRALDRPSSRDAAAPRRIAACLVASAAVLLTFPGLVLASRLQVPATEPYTTTTYALTVLALLAPIGLWREARHAGAPSHATLFALCSASLVAGTTVLWASANGLRNAPLGLLPASLIGLAVVTGRVRTEARTRPTMTRHALPGLVFLAGFLLFALHQLFTGVYRDTPMGGLTTRIEEGVYRGMISTPHRKAFIATLQRDLDALPDQVRSVAFLDHFPGGYLMSALRPATPTVWTFPPAGVHQGNQAMRRVYASHYDDPAELPDVVVLMNRIRHRSFINVRLPPGDPVLARFSPRLYTATVRRPDYTIAVRKKETVRP